MSDELREERAARIPWWLVREAEASVRLSQDEEGTHVVGDPADAIEAGE